MKIAIFTDTFSPQVNGVVSVIKEQIKELKNKGVEVIVFAPSKKTHMEYFEGVRVYYFSAREVKVYSGYLLTKVENAIKINAIVEMENPDIFYIHTPFIMGLMGLSLSKKYSKPSVGVFHTLLSEYTGHLTNGKNEKLVKTILKKPTWEYIGLFYRRVKVTIALGKEIAKRLKKEGNIKNIKIIPNGIDISRLQKTKTKDIRKRYKIPKGAMLFFFLGRVSLEKRINILINAFNDASKEKNIYLIIGGTGPQLQKYKQLSKENDRIIFTGFIPDNELASYYNSADVFISASDTEVCPITFLEAMAFKCALIGADKMGSKDIIRNGVNGLTFKSGNTKSLSSIIKKISSNKKDIKRMKEKSFSILKRYYSIDKITDEYISIFKRLLNKKIEKNHITHLLDFWPKLKKVIQRKI